MARFLAAWLAAAFVAGCVGVSADPEARPAFGPGEAPTGETSVGSVAFVIDGDTFNVVVDGEEIRVRLIGLDAPEIRDDPEWLGPEARAALADLIDGREVVLERDISEVDRFGRALRHVWLEDGDGWLLVNAEIIRLGLAVARSYPPDTTYDDLYDDAEADAQAAGIGLWMPSPAPS